MYLGTATVAVITRIKRKCRCALMTALIKMFKDGDIALCGIAVLDNF